MRPSAVRRALHPSGNRLAPGTYLRCASCGKLLKINFAVRTIVCSCGARLTPPTPESGDKLDPKSNR